MKLRFVFILGITICTSFLSGCETFKGMRNEGSQGISKGFEKDWKNIQNTDEQIKENLW